MLRNATGSYPPLSPVICCPEACEYECVSDESGERIAIHFLAIRLVIWPRIGHFFRLLGSQVQTVPHDISVPNLLA